MPKIVRPGWIVEEGPPDPRYFDAIRGIVFVVVGLAVAALLGRTVLLLVEVPYVFVLLPTTAVGGMIAAAYSLLRGRRRAALVCGLVGIGAAVIVIVAYYASV
jgi:hypothetical protein